ncbi:hypothetical protein [Bdellovibrio bacteriovorus]|uniref:hypothetical protein n=1 Tax=Bdellovibrio bacteriovorus TaxID=959 RepID=UPI003AA96E1E
MGAKKLSIDDKAVFFDVYLNCYGNSNRLKQALFAALTTTGLPDTSRPILKKLLVNLALVPDGSALALPLNHEFYGRIEAKNAGLSYFKVKKVLDALLQHKFVQVIKGTEATGITRVYPCYKLQRHLKMLSDIIYLEKSDAGMLVLRNKHKEDLYIQQNEETLSIIRNLAAINEHLLKFKYTAIDKRFFPQLTRVFNLDLESGGRFYCHVYQSLSRKKGERQTIKIDERETVELDYKAMHPNILYALANATAPADPYSVPGFARDDAKVALNIMFNAETEKAALGAIQHNEKLSKRYSEEEAISLMQELVAHNLPIAQFLSSGAGVKLQFLDSKLCEAILLQAVEDNIAVLPVHDSFICQKQDEAYLARVMQEKAEQVLNVKLRVEKK